MERTVAQWLFLWANTLAQTHTHFHKCITAFGGIICLIFLLTQNTVSTQTHTHTQLGGADVPFGMSLQCYGALHYSKPLGESRKRLGQSMLIQLLPRALIVVIAPKSCGSIRITMAIKNINKEQPPSYKCQPVLNPPVVTK